MLLEVYHYLLRLDNSRHIVRAMLRGLPAEALNWTPELPASADPMNSMAALAVHLAGAEQHWFSEVIGGAVPTRDRDAEFAYVANSAEEPLARLDAVAAASEAVLSQLTAEELDGEKRARDRMMPVRFIILHVIDHYALHIGHMQITYQLWNAGQAFQAPHWFERRTSREEQ